MSLWPLSAIVKTQLVSCHFCFLIVREIKQKEMIGAGVELLLANVYFSEENRFLASSLTDVRSCDNSSFWADLFVRIFGWSSPFFNKIFKEEIHIKGADKLMLRKCAYVFGGNLFHLYAILSKTIIVPGLGYHDYWFCCEDILWLGSCNNDSSHREEYYSKLFVFLHIHLCM